MALRNEFSKEKGEVHGLFEAPIAKAAETVHCKAHGGVTNEIVEV
jgi:hypothetical protein